MSEQAWCKQCGEALLPDAKFCGKCGSKVQEEALHMTVPAKEPSAPDNKEIAGTPKGTAMSTKASQTQLDTLIGVIWLTIGLSALSGIISIFDIRDYYALGRFGTFLGEAVFLCLYVWLATALAERKNWARITYIAYSLLLVMLGLLSFATAKTGLCWFIDLATLLMTVYCVVKLFGKKMARCCVPAGDGVKRAAIFWGVFVALIVFMGIYTEAHQTSRDYLTDCANAAAKGSDEAYADLITYSIEHSNVSGSEEEIVEAAIQEVNEFIASTTQGSCRATASKQNSKRSNGKTDWGKIFRIIAIVGCLTRAWWEKRH